MTSVRRRQFKMSLEVSMQQFFFELSWLRNECTFNFEIAAEKQIFDLATNDLFEPARVKKSARPAIASADSLPSGALAAAGLTNVHDVRVTLNPWYWLRSADYIHAM
jgi:hypothetical protein